MQFQQKHCTFTVRYKEPTKRKENTNEESVEIEQGMVVAIHAILEQKEQR